MRAGALRHKVTIEQPTNSQDSMGGLTQTWTTYAIRFAEVKPLSGREFFDAQQYAADVNYRIRLRYDDTSKNITPSMRVSWDSRVFDIESVINRDERNKEIILMCLERI